MKVLLAAGGTAGHIEPALTLADALTEADPACEVVFVGRSVGLEARLVPERGRRLRTLPAVPLPRKPSKDLVLVGPRVAGSLRAMRRILDEERPDVVVGFGGYVAFPAYLAARRYGKPLPVVVHEANARAGLANRVGARSARRVLAAVPSSGLRGAEVVGVSNDDVASHKGFCSDEALPFPLLADTDERLAHAFGVPTRLGFYRRTTFVIDGAGVVRRVFDPVEPRGHAREVLSALAELPPAPATGGEAR